MNKSKRTLFSLAFLTYFKFVYLQEQGISVTEHSGGRIINDKLVFYKAQSPYLLKNDVIVESNGEVIIEAGVTIKIEPQVGITVRGILTAEVS